MVSPVVDWQPVQGVSRLLSNVSWDQLQPPATLYYHSVISFNCLDRQNNCTFDMYIIFLSDTIKVLMTQGVYKMFGARWNENVICFRMRIMEGTLTSVYRHKLCREWKQTALMSTLYFCITFLSVLTDLWLLELHIACYICILYLFIILLIV